MMTKVRFELSPKPSKQEKAAQGKTGFVPVPVRWVIERSNAWMERGKSLTKNFERTLGSCQGKNGSLLRQANAQEACSFFVRSQIGSINGQIITKPMPQGKHSTLHGDLTMAIEMALKPERIGRAFPELRCSFGNRSVVLDISVFINQRIPRNADGTIANQFMIAPDWVIEILSPSQSQTKVIKNILYCLKHGTQLGWLIDPDEQTILIHSLEYPLRVFDTTESPDQRLPVPPFANSMTLTTHSIINWLLD